MSEPVIPDVANELPASPAVTALRKEAGMLQNAVYALGEMPVKAKEAAQAAELLAYLDGLAAAKVREVESLVATEILGAPVEADGTKLSLAKAH